MIPTGEWRSASAPPPGVSPIAHLAVSISPNGGPFTQEETALVENVEYRYGR